MKTALFFLLFFPTLAIADCVTTSGQETVEDKLVISTDVPKHLEGATITVKLKDGTISTVPAEKFKVVPRHQQYLVTKVKQTDQTMCKADKEKNRLSAMIGQGPKPGLTYSRSAHEVDVESRVGTVGGVQYQRLLNDKWSLGVQGQSNQTGLINLGYDF